MIDGVFISGLRLEISLLILFHEEAGNELPEKSYFCGIDWGGDVAYIEIYVK